MAHLIPFVVFTRPRCVVIERNGVKATVWRLAGDSNHLLSCLSGYCPGTNWAVVEGRGNPAEGYIPIDIQECGERMPKVNSRNVASRARGNKARNQWVIAKITVREENAYHSGYQVRLHILSMLPIGRLTHRRSSDAEMQIELTQLFTQGPIKTGRTARVPNRRQGGVHLRKTKAVKLNPGSVLRTPRQKKNDQFQGNH